MEMAPALWPQLHMHEPIELIADVGLVLHDHFSGVSTKR